MTEKFIYNDERFADIEMLRYPLLGFETLTLQQKLYIYCLSEATLYGRDITFDQFGRYNLVIRKTLEAVLRHYEGDRTTKDFLGFETYLKQVWFASGIHHHYGCEKFVPTFSEDFLRHEVLAIDREALPWHQDRRPANCSTRSAPYSSTRRCCRSASTSPTAWTWCRHQRATTIRG